MAAPSQGITRFDLSTTYSEFSLRQNRKGFVGLEVFPLLKRNYKGTTEYLRLKLESLSEAKKSTVRAPDGSYAESEYQWDKANYKMEDHGAVERVSDAERDRWGDIIRQEIISAERALDRVLRAIERDISSAVFSNDWKYKTAVGTPFTDHGAATPFDVIRDASRKVRNRIGTKPNTLVITDDGWTDMVLCAQFEDKLESGTNDDPNHMTMMGLKNLFKHIENIVIASGVDMLQTNQNKAVTFDNMWDSSMMMLCHVNKDGMNGDLSAPMPNIGRTLIDVGGFQPLPGSSSADDPLVIMEEYRDENVRLGKIRARNYRGIEIIHPEAGELITGIR